MPEMPLKGRREKKKTAIRSELSLLWSGVNKGRHTQRAAAWFVWLGDLYFRSFRAFLSLCIKIHDVR